MSSDRRLSRRSLLRVAGVAGGAAALAACGVTPTPQIVEKIVERTVEVEKIVEQTVEVEKVVEVEKEPVKGSDLAGGVSMWVFPLTQNDAEALWNPLTARFRESYPNISVSIELLPWAGRREKMMTAFAAGQPPDMAYVNTDTISLFGMNDVLLPLDDIVPAEAWEDIFGNLIPGLTWQGKRIMYPTLLIGEGYLYNKGLAAEVGWDPEKAPETWDDIRALGEAGKAQNLWLTRQYSADWDTYVQWVWQAGGNIFDPEVTEVLLMSDPAKEALGFLVEMFANGWVPKEGAVASPSEQSQASTAVNYWIEGKQLLSDQSNASVTTNTQQQNAEIDFGYCPVFKNKRQVTVGGAGCWGIFKGAKNLEPTQAWLAWLTGPEQQGFYGSVTGFAPPREASWNFWASPPGPKRFYEIRLPYLEMNQDVNYFYNEATTITAPYFQAAVLQSASVDEALALAQDELQVLVDEWNAKRG